MEFKPKVSFNAITGTSRFLLFLHLATLSSQNNFSVVS